MSEFTDQLKEKADIGRLIGEVVALKPGGNGFTGLCPFHGEKTPSFHVHTFKRFYYCFGCHAHGDVYQFFMQLRKITFPEAVELVAERLGVPVPRLSDRDADPRRAPLLEAHTVAAEFFRQSLRAAAGASCRAYLQGRELPPPAWERFGLGYAPEGGRALTLHLQQRGVSAAVAQQAGLCQLRRESAAREVPGAAEAAEWSDLYDRFRHRLVFPITDERGQVIAFGARLLEGGDADRKAPKYLNSPESPLYTKGRVLYNLDRAREAIRELKYVILVEGYFDCIRVFTAGFENVVASCGTALTAAQMKPVSRLAQNAMINFDPDTAGAAAAERSIGMLLEENFKIRVVVLPGGQDPDAFIREHGKEGYREALQSSRTFFDYLAARVRGQFDLRRPEGKVAALNHLLPYLGRVQEPILRQQLAENVAAQLGVDQQSVVSRQLLDAARDRRAALAPAAMAPAELLPAERTILRAWLEWEDLRPKLEAAISGENLLSGLASFALSLVLFEHSDADIAVLAQKLEPSDRALLAKLLMPGEEEEPLTRATAAAALEALRERRQPTATGALKAQIEEAVRQGDRARLEELLRQKQDQDRQFREPSKRRGTAAGA